MSKKYEVVISGVGGQFPECDGLEEFRVKLNSKVNLVTEENCKWTPGELGVPHQTGKIKDSNGFDHTFFGIHTKLCEIMDPHIRLCLERSFEAICDAGVNPGEISGCNVATIMASMTSETEYGSVTVAASSGYGMLGHSRTMQSNRISYILNLNGPSFVMDSSWTGGMQGLKLAQTLISTGQVTSALVGVCSLMFRPEVSFHYDRMGKLSHDGTTKSFSDDADGYSRSEACVVFFMQRADDARRSYGTVIDVIVPNYGARDCGFLSYSPEHYKDAITEIYTRNNIDPNSVAFIELDGTAEKKSDEMELNSFDEFLGKKRDKPLLIGSVKSNVGHTEAASSFVSIAKALVALDSGIVPPNINYTNPNKNCPGLVSGRLEVPTEPTPLTGTIIGISCNGMVGTYAHAILKQNPKQKKRTAQKSILPPDGIPRLLVMSGRDEAKLKDSFTKIEGMPIDEEFIGLMHKVFSRDVQKHLLRGYTILSEDKPEPQIQEYVGGEKRPVWFVFSGMGSQWPGMGAQLMKLPIFAQAIHKCQKVLQPKGIDLIDIITNPDPSTFDTILHSFVGIAAVQIGLVDVLRTLEIEPDGIIGHSVGELGCAYADGCFTAEQMILSAYARGRASVETPLIKGMMAAVGLGYNQIKDELPPSIEVACHNSADSCTLSGPEKDMEVYIQALKARGVFARLVNVANIAYHSKHIAPAAPTLLKYLKEVIPEPKPRSARWVSSSVPEKNWDGDLAKLNSAEYHTNNLLSSVLFEEASTHIPNNSIVIEIAPHGLLQAILRRSLASCSNVGLTNRSQKDGLKYLLSALGKLYLEGVELKLSKLYPEISFPVSRTTPSIHNLLSWIHVENANSYMCVAGLQIINSFKFLSIRLSDETCQIYTQHKINDQVVVPTSTFLSTVIDVYNNFWREKIFSGPLTFHNNVIHRNATIVPKVCSEFYCQIQQGSGDFEVCNEEATIVSGRITATDDSDHVIAKCDFLDFGQLVTSFAKSDVYLYFSHFGIEHGAQFRSIEKIEIFEKGIKAKVVWKGNWTFFLDSIFKVISLYVTSKENHLCLVSSIKQMIIDPNEFPEETTEFEVLYDFESGVLKCGGLEVVCIRASGHGITEIQQTETKYEKQVFVPYARSTAQDDAYLPICMQLALENFTKTKDWLSTKVTVVEIQDGFSQINEIKEILSMQKDFEVDVLHVNPNKPLPEDVLKEVNSSNSIIISWSDIHPYVLTLVGCSIQSFLITCSGKQTELSDLNLMDAYQQKTSKGTVRLLKRTISSTQNIEIILTSRNKWLADLDFTLKRTEKQTNRRVFIVHEGNSEAAVNEIVNRVTNQYNSSDVRFFFLDEKMPPFSVNKPEYKSHIEHDMKINIYHNGQWGSLRLLPLTTGSYKSNRIHDPIKPLNQVKCSEAQIKCLGLNLDQDSNEKLGVLEFSGVSPSGQSIFGISALTDNTHTIDPHLCWVKPNKWTHEEAATVPVSYLIAYYALGFTRNLADHNSILITNAASTISVAAVNVALSVGAKIYLLCSDEEDKREILKSFPTISPKRVFTNYDKGFVRNIRLDNNGERVDFVFNNDPSLEVLHSTLSCIAVRGGYFQANPAPLKRGNDLGMNVFLLEIAIYGITVNNLATLAPLKKKQLQTVVQNGIKSNIVVPLRKKVVNYSLNSHQAVCLLREEPNNLERTVLPLSDNKEVEKMDFFLCNDQKSYLIVGTRGSLWLETIEWLIMRGAAIIFIAIDKQLVSKFISLRLKGILAQHPAVQVQFVPPSRLSSLSSARQLISNINVQSPLGATLALEVASGEHLSHLDSALQLISPKSEFICFGMGENICQERRRKGLPALALIWADKLSKPSDILTSLDSLIRNPDCSSSVIVVSEYKLRNTLAYDASTLRVRHLPDTLLELEDFCREISDRPCFEEVATLAPKYAYTKELAPIIFVPGLKPKQIDGLIENIMYPALKVKLPAHIESIESAAQQLVEEASKFRFDVFTIVASEWGGALGLCMAKLLEKAGKTACLMLLDGAPKVNQSWASIIAESHYNTLLSKYFLMSPKVYQEIHFSRNWTEKLSILFTNTEYKDDVDRDLVRVGLSSIKNRIEALLNFKFEGKLDCKICLVRPDGFPETDDCGLSEYSIETVNIFISDDQSFQDMVLSPKTMEVLNNIALVEYKDRARLEHNAKYKSINILVDAKYNSPQLVRV